METDTNSLRKSIFERIEGAADPQVKAWWERYMRHAIPFAGVNLTIIRDIVLTEAETACVKTYSIDQFLSIAESFFAEDMAESKLAGVVLLEHFGRMIVPWERQVEFLSGMLEKRFIYDWNVCDWLCVRVLGPLIESYGTPCAHAVGQWRDSEYLWKARCSLVPFAYITANPKFSSEFLASCDMLIKRPERFAKTAVGWILREYSKTDAEAVLRFTYSNTSFFSREVLNNTLKLLPPESKTDLLPLIPKVVAAAKKDCDPWLDLAGSVEPLFGPMKHNGKFKVTLIKHISEKRALCIRGEENLTGGILVSTDRNQISWLAVTPEKRGRGLGSALLAKGLQSLDMNREISVQTFEDTISEGQLAQKLYHKFGFAVNRTAGLNPAGVPTVIMVRPAGITEYA